jgi:hypothetical protein
MYTTVRDSSVLSFDQIKAAGVYGEKKEAIIDYLSKTRRGAWATRLQIANYLGFTTATVSGLITPMIEAGDIEENPNKERDPTSPRNSRVYWIRIKPNQKTLFN